MTGSSLINPCDNIVFLPGRPGFFSSLSGCYFHIPSPLFKSAAKTMHKCLFIAQTTRYSGIYVAFDLNFRVLLKLLYTDKASLKNALNLESCCCLLTHK